MTLRRYVFSSKSQQVSSLMSGLCGCLWPYEGTFFLANHNSLRQSPVTMPVFVTLRRYVFSSKSQQTTSFYRGKDGCLWPYEGTFFLANHNRSLRWVRGKLVFVTLRRYVFSSKSQPALCGQWYRQGCLWPYEGTFFLANHNPSSLNFFARAVFVTLRRYVFSSKSQRGLSCSTW